MELEFINWLRERIGPHPSVVQGIGDDAAELTGLQPCLVVTTDMLMDGVDFQVGQVSPRRIGHKALAVNLSDIAAMGADPVAAFISLSIPQQGGGLLCREVYEGIFPLASRYGVAIAGGDTNSWSGPLVVNITIVGQKPQPGTWLRRSAKPGDWILATGEFGGSILNKHLDFEPRLDESRFLRNSFNIHAAIDVSDGLSLDLWRVLKESRVGATLYPERIPIAKDAMVCAATSGRSALDHALSDGEDFELIVTLPAEDAQQALRSWNLATRLTHIGEVVTEPGMHLVDSSGQQIPLQPKGYQHLFSAT